MSEVMKANEVKRAIVVGTASSGALYGSVLAAALQQEFTIGVPQLEGSDAGVVKFSAEQQQLLGNERTLVILMYFIRQICGWWKGKKPRRVDFCIL